MGYAIITLSKWNEITTYIGLIETVSYQTAKIILTLAILHYFNDSGQNLSKTSITLKLFNHGKNKNFYWIPYPIAISLTYYVSRTLFKNGKIFMNIFNGKEEIALATNKLFKEVFYLLNIGWAF